MYSPFAIYIDLVTWVSVLFQSPTPIESSQNTAYMARYIAKNIVAADLADVCEIQLSYAIGFAEPISVHVDCQGTAKIDESLISSLVQKHFDLTPKGIIESLGLLSPIYASTAYHGHFGRTPGESGSGTFSWENTDKADLLRSSCDCKATAE